MSDIRKSLSKLKKSFKHRVGGKKHAADRPGADAAGETASSSLSATRPVTASGRGEEENRVSTDISQAHSRDRSPQPTPIQAGEGRDNLQGREADVDEKKASRSHSRPGPDVGGAEGSSREIKQTPSPLSVTPISPKQEPDSTWTFSPQQPCLIALLGNEGAPAIPGHVLGDPRSDETAESSAAANEKKSSWKSTAFATAKLLLRGVRDSADAFGPLKSVAGGLCFILENCEVWPYPCLQHHNPYRYSSE